MDTHMDGAHFTLAVDGFEDEAASRAERVNEDIGGHALAAWLSERLTAKGHAGSRPWVEDHGWAFDISHEGRVYLCTCSIDESEPGPREAHVSIDLMRGLKDRLFGRNRMAGDDRVVAAVRDLLASDGRLRIKETVGAELR